MNFNSILTLTTFTLLLFFVSSSSSPSSSPLVSAANPECVPVEEFDHIGKSLLDLNDMKKSNIYFCGPDAPTDMQCECPSVFQCNDFTIHWGNIGTCGCCPPWIIGLIVMLFIAIFVSLVVAVYLCMCRGTWWCDGQQQAPSIVLPMRSAPVRVPEGANVGTNIFRGYRPSEFDTGRGSAGALALANAEERQPLVQNGGGGENNNNNNNNTEADGSGGGDTSTTRRRRGNRRTGGGGGVDSSSSPSLGGGGTATRSGGASALPMSPPPPVPTNANPRPQQLPSFNLMSPPGTNQNSQGIATNNSAHISPTHVDVQPATERSLNDTTNSNHTATNNNNNNRRRASGSNNNNNRGFNDIISDDDATEMQESAVGGSESDFFVAGHANDGRFSQRNSSSHDHPMSGNVSANQHPKADLEISDAEDASDIMPPGTNNGNIRRMVPPSASSTAAAGKRMPPPSSNNNIRSKNPIPPLGTSGSKKK